MNRTYVIGHVNPDTDSIASAMGYAWLLSQMNGSDVVAARAGPINEQTAWILEVLGLKPPLILTDASPRFQAVTQRLDTVTPDRPLRDAWALANRTGFVAPVVDQNGLPVSLITGISLFNYLGRVVGPDLDSGDVQLSE